MVRPSLPLTPHPLTSHPLAPHPLTPHPSPGIFLNARMNAKYEQRVARRLDAALSKLDSVGAVRYVNCSFPSVPADAPRMELLEYSSLESSRCRLTFSLRCSLVS